MIVRSCEICSSTIKIKPSHAKKGFGRFCSRKCWGVWKSRNQIGRKSSRWQGGGIKKTCQHCGQEYETAPYRAGDSNYCSYRCSNQGRKTKIKANCDYCNTPIEIYPSHLKHSRHFCSGGCMYKYQSGPGCPSWRGGKSFEPYPPTFNARFKRMIRDRDSYTCLLCNNPGNCVHHIDYNKDNTTSENCITLCFSCHGKTNFNRDYWQKIILNLKGKDDFMRVLKAGRNLL